MNLAEIRKKAQRERREREEAAISEAPVGSEPRLLPSCAIAESLSQPVEPFDPLGVILAGREAVSAAALREVTPAPVPEEELAGFLSFTVGGEIYALEIGRVKETLRSRKVTPVPRAPESITGIISHRGAIISILNLAERLGLDHRFAAGAGRIVVVRKGGGLCGLLVDGLGRVVMLPPSAIEPAPAGRTVGSHDCVAGIARNRGAMLILLDLDKVLDIGGRST